MIIKSVDLKSFRSYTRFHIDLDPVMNIIIGKNGIGKTNILESLVMVSNTKSFRTSDDMMMIKSGEEYAFIEVDTPKDKLKVIITKEGKFLYLNNNPIRKTSDFIGKLNVILFKPNDLELFDDTPKSRRKLIDVELSKISREYLNDMVLYTKLLKDKNNLLKNQDVDRLYLETIESRMVDPIINIITLRSEMIDFINTKISDYYQKLSGTDITIRIDYHKSSDNTLEAVKEMIDRSHERDLMYQYTTNGPQKEDYSFYFDENEISGYASQGQRRMCMIAFKLAIADYIKNKTGTEPVLLLDDIMSELDIENRSRLFEVLPSNIQTIITSTDLDNIKIKDKYKVFKLRKEATDDK